MKVKKAATKNHIHKVCGIVDNFRLSVIQFSTFSDEPHVLKHTVKKPVYQEVNEIITPYRKITQEVKPVQEDIQTIIARMSGGSNMGGGYSSGSSGKSAGSGMSGGAAAAGGDDEN